MTNPYVDTDILIRLLTGDDLEKQAEAASLFERVEAGDLTVAAPDTVIADAVYVLASPEVFYHGSRTEVRDFLAPLVRLPHFRVQNSQAVLAALDLYAATNLDFGDALIVASMQQQGSTVLYSFDRDFDRIPPLSDEY